MSPLKVGDTTVYKGKSGQWSFIAHRTSGILVFFFLHDGDAIWAWTVRLFPDQHEATVRAIGVRAWAALAGYVRGVAMVGLTEACVMGVALWIIGVPVVLPLAVIVFCGTVIVSWLSILLYHRIPFALRLIFTRSHRAAAE